MMVKLFDDKERLNSGPALHNYNTYMAYNDSTDPGVVNIRNLISRWFDTYPETEKNELKGLFKVKFHHAFFELFIYQLFTAMGYHLTVHPNMPGTDKYPDFLAVKNNYSFFLEAKFMDMQSQEAQAKERRKNALLDALNKVDANNFLLCIQTIEFKDRSQPNGKKIIGFFNQQLLAHDPEIYRTELEATGFRHMPLITFDDDQVTIKIKLMPKAVQLGDTDSGAIASLPSVFKMGNDCDAIREALETKATRYGQPNLPFVICLNKQTVSFDLQEMKEALYGNVASPGFFGTEKNKKFTRVSGVYFTNANTANLVSTAIHAFDPNFFAAQPIDFALTDSIAAILNIPDNYHTVNYLS